MTGEQVQFWSGTATILALPVGIGALIYAGCQLSLARKAGSGASLIALSESFRQNWKVYLAATTDAERNYAFGDLSNSLEIACAVFSDGVFHGRSKTVLEAYLINVFALIEVSALARQHLEDLLEVKETFEDIRIFAERHQTAIRGASARIRKGQTTTA